MDVNLSDGDAELLRRILTSYLSDLRMEIVDTDNHEYKAKLKAEQSQLRDILDRIGGPAGG
ncbi:MAG: hypothetical protein K1X95_05695 [Acidimicrobiia bacterium]|nr:hypothetical protein [Acidimicrobiia bacterium]